MAVLGDTMLSGQLRLRYVDKNRDRHSLNWQMQQGWRLQLKGQQAPHGQGALLKWREVPAPPRAGPVNVLSRRFLEVRLRKAGWPWKEDWAPSMEI